MTCGRGKKQRERECLGGQAGKHGCLGEGKARFAYSFPPIASTKVTSFWHLKVLVNFGCVNFRLIAEDYVLLGVISEF